MKTKKTPYEICRDAVKQAQKQVARAEAAACKAELPLARTLNAINGQLYEMAGTLTKAATILPAPEATPLPATPLPLQGTVARAEAPEAAA